VIERMSCNSVFLSAAYRPFLSSIRPVNRMFVEERFAGYAPGDLPHTRLPIHYS
jgi:hypothetical protein